MYHSSRLWSCALALSFLILGSCTPKKPDGFQVEGSAFTFKTKTFEDQNTLAEAAGQKFTKDQILDKSPVLKDLDQQQDVALVGLAYLRLLQLIPAKEIKGTMEVNLPDPKVPLATILGRFDQPVPPGFAVVYKKSEDDNQIAKFKEHTLLRDELAMNHSILQGMEQRRFEETVAQLSGQLARILINEEAAKKQMELQAYIDAEVLKGQSTSVSDSEVFAYTDRIGLSRDELKGDLMEKMRSSLQARKGQEILEKYAAEKIIKGPVYVSFSKPELKITLDSNWKAVAGYNSAPVSLVVFGSPTCPDCITLIQHLRETFKKYDGHLKLNWIYNFSDNDGIANMVSRASLCVDTVKPGHTLDFLGEFSAKADQSDEIQFLDWSEKLGANRANFQTCMTSDLSRDVLKQHLDYSKKNGILANPTLWIEGRTVQGMITPSRLDSMVQEAISNSGSTNLGAWWRRTKARFGL